MALNVQCAFCGAGFEVDDRQAGQGVRCPACRRIVRVPASEELALRAELHRLSGDAAAGKPDARPEQPPAGAVFELEEEKPSKAPAFQEEVTQAPISPGTSGRTSARRGHERLVSILSAVVAVAVALAIGECFRAMWAAVASASGGGVRDIAAGLRDWGGGLVPRLEQLRPAIAQPFGAMDQLIVAAILVPLALRIMFRTVLLDEGYGTGEGSDRRGVAGLVFHACALVVLVAMVAWATSAVQEQRAELVAWLLMSFLLVSTISLAAIRLVSHVRGNAVMGRMFNDGIFGCACLLVLRTGGIPDAPFGVVEQCSVLVLANSIVGLAITGTAFERGTSGKVVKRLGFSALGVMILCVVVLLFATARQVR
jgi:hypothetical protein